VKDARCLDCDAPMDPNPLFYKYLGGLIIVVALVLAGAWIVLAGQGSTARPF
jgi:flagellar biogenesis protein FliO